MTTYTISVRSSGLTLGAYEGSTPAEAVAAMRLEAGYSSAQELADQLSTTVEALDADLCVTVD